MINVLKLNCKTNTARLTILRKFAWMYKMNTLVHMLPMLKISENKTSKSSLAQILFKYPCILFMPQHVGLLNLNIH